MAESIKDRMYNYEEVPPAGVWQEIAAALDMEQTPVVELPKKNKRVLYYSVAAAASVAIIIFALIFFRPSKTDSSTFTAYNSDSSRIDSNDVATNTTEPSEDPDITGVIMTAPEEKVVKKDDVAKNDKKGPSKKVDDKTTKPDEGEGETDETKDSDKPAYITITGPEGQPVKVSSKVTALMESTEDPSKPVWNKKVSEWKSLMQSNTLAPTPGNFLDIVELTKSLRAK